MSPRLAVRLLLPVFLATAAAAAGQTSPSTLLVLNKDEASLAIVDLASKTVVGRVPTGDGPHELVTSTDGRTAFVSNYGGQTPGSSLSVINLAARRERRVDLGPLRRPHGLAFADGRLYFTAEANRVVARYNPSTSQVDWLLGTGQSTTHMVLVDRDAGRMFTANIGSDSVTAIERGANPQAWTETVIPVGKGPEGIDWSPDGREVWTAHSRDGGVSIIDVAGKKVVQTLDLHTKRSNRLKFTPDGRLVLVSDLDAGQLIVVDAAARREVTRVTVGRNPEGILIAPDGACAYVAVNGDNIVAVVDLKSFAVVDRLATGAGPDGMAFGGPSVAR